MPDGAEQALLVHTARIVSAFVSRTPCAVDDLPALITQVRQALAGLDTTGLGASGAAPDAPVADRLAAHRPEPAVPIKRSVFPDHIVCLEDGKRLKTLKRHLASAYGLTPDAYRARWGLPATYPMVAPDYASARSRLAREMGLGRSTRPEEPAT